MIKISSLLDQEKIKEGMEKGILKEWMITTYSDFRNSLLDDSAPYPCYFAVEAEKNGLIRYIFAESAYDTHELLNIRDGVYEYIKSYKSIGKRTTLVIFFKPSENELRAEDYKKQFWNVVKFLNENDPEPWPSEIPKDPNHPEWEFCFGGDPIFLVCRAPFYSDRKSRFTANGLEITMQPRGTLDDITADTKLGQQSCPSKNHI